jgi:hypothetical protein
MKDNKKWFAGSITEYNGEQEYKHDIIMQAKTLDEAIKIAEATAHNWYEDADVEEELSDKGDLSYSFFGGILGCRVDSVYETTIKEWCKRQFESCKVS